MAFHHSPKIVTNGLVLCLDAANRKSYSGAGTVWRDLAGFNNGTLTNGPTFNSANGGSIVFDGGDDYISIANSPSLEFGETFTVNTWLIASSLTSRRGIFSTRFSNSGGAWQLEVGAGSSGINRIAVSGLGTWIWESPNNTITTNTWYNICYVKPNNAFQGGLIYLNGIQIPPQGTNGYTITNNSSVKVIGSGTSSGQLFPGRISQVSVYNRALTPAEVLQNYNATKGRYNL